MQWFLNLCIRLIVRCIWKNHPHAAITLLYENGQNAVLFKLIDMFSRECRRLKNVLKGHWTEEGERAQKEMRVAFALALCLCDDRCASRFRHALQSFSGEADFKDFLRRVHAGDAFLRRPGHLCLNYSNVVGAFLHDVHTPWTAIEAVAAEFQIELEIDACEVRIFSILQTMRGSNAQYASRLFKDVMQTAAYHRDRNEGTMVAILGQGIELNLIRDAFELASQYNVPLPREKLKAQIQPLLDNGQIDLAVEVAQRAGQTLSMNQLRAWALDYAERGWHSYAASAVIYAEQARKGELTAAVD